MDGFTFVSAKKPPPPTPEQITLELKLREENDELERQSRLPLLALMFPNRYSLDTNKSGNPFGTKGTSLENILF